MVNGTSVPDGQFGDYRRRHSGDYPGQPGDPGVPSPSLKLSPTAVELKNWLADVERLVTRLSAAESTAQTTG